MPAGHSTPDRTLRSRSRARPRSLAAPEALALALAMTLAGPAAAQARGTGGKPFPAGPAWKEIDAILGRAGQPQPGGVQKYGFPRSDLTVKVGDVTVKPALALGSWVAFKGTASDAVAMGDLVLTEREVTPVISKLQEMGVEQTALHNHMLDESPRVMYLHFEGRGDPKRVARAIRAALALTGTPEQQPAAAGPVAPIPLDTARVARLLGRGGKVNGGVYQVSVPRAETVRAHGVEVPPSLGVATAINFQATAGGKTAITGDFVLTAGEVNPVIRELRAAGIVVTALHSHLLTEEPRLFFMHFWANDDPVKLARGLRAALDRMRVERTRS